MTKLLSKFTKLLIYRRTLCSLILNLYSFLFLVLALALTRPFGLFAHYFGNSVLFFKLGLVVRCANNHYNNH